MTIARGGPLVLAVDVGSSSVRGVLYNESGRAHRGPIAQVRYRMDADRRGGVSIAAERLLGALVETIDTLVEARAVDLRRVVGVGISCFLHSMAGVDRNGRPLTPLLTWADTTSAAEADELRSELEAAALWIETGAPLHASYWPAKIVALRRRLGDPPAGFAGAPTLLWEALTGQRGIDLSHASGTGLLDRRRGDWHDGLMKHLSIGIDALPPIVPHRTSAPLSGWAADRWPALAGMPWFVPWSDASSGNVGLGAVAGGPAALQVGTSGALRVVRPEPDPPVVPGLFAHRLADGSSLLGGQLSEGGGTAAAMARLLGGTPSALERDASQLAPDGHNLTVLPFLAGERGPGYHAAARGVVAGLTLATTRSELYLATVEAIALRFAALDRRLSSVLGGPQDIVASGGAVARSRLLPIVLAGALGRRIAVSSEGEASARGAALQALAGCGVIASPAAVPPPASIDVDADPARARAYAAARDRQEALYRTWFGDASDAWDP